MNLVGFLKKKVNYNIHYDGREKRSNEDYLKNHDDDYRAGLLISEIVNTNREHFQDQIEEIEKIKDKAKKWFEGEERARRLVSYPYGFQREDARRCSGLISITRCPVVRARIRPEHSIHSRSSSKYSWKMQGSSCSLTISLDDSLEIFHEVLDGLLLPRDGFIPATICMTKQGSKLRFKLVKGDEWEPI